MGNIEADSGRSSRARALRAWLLSAVVVVLVVGIRVLRDPQAFFLWDRVAQYAATYHYIGEQLRSGTFPLLVPWQGTSSNLLLDAQYGLMSPIYLVQNVAYSFFSDLATGTTVLVTVFLIVLQSGVFLWVLRLSDSPRWAAVAGIAAPLTGYVFWWSAPSWHPSLVSTAFLPWLGWALARDKVTGWGVLTVAVSAYATFSTGWPITAVAALVIVVAACVEAVTAARLKQALVNLVAVGGAGLLAMPTVLFTAGAIEWTMRTSSVNNTNFLVPNLADVLTTWMASSASNMNFFGSPIDTEPTTLAVGFGLIVAPLIAWRKDLWARTGFLTVIITAATALLLTQGPSEFGPLRWPVRFLGLWQISVVVLIAAAAGALGVVVTRKRLVISAGLLAAGYFIAVSRTPSDLVLHTASLVLAAAFVAGFAAMRRSWGPLALSAVLVGISTLAMLGQPTSDQLPPRIPSALSAYQNPLAPTDERVLTLFPDRLNYLQLVEQGVYPGQNVLLSPARAGLGYTSVGQEPLQSRMCTAVQGWTCVGVFDFLGSREPQTGETWLDLLGINTLVVHTSYQAPAEAILTGEWTQSGQSQDFVVLSRADDDRLVGRTTSLGAGITAAALTSQTDTEQVYQIAADTPSRLVVSDVYWPGYQATWNGQDLPVTPIGEALVSVEVPAGEGELAITYRPTGTTLAMVAVALGLLLAAAAVAGGPRFAARRQRAE